MFTTDHGSLYSRPKRWPLAALAAFLMVLLGAYVIMVINKPADNMIVAPASSDDHTALRADGLSDFEAVCNGQGIANAAKYDADIRPYKMTTFVRNPAHSGSNWTSTSLGFGEKYYVDPAEFASTAVVACVQLDEADTKLVDRCEITTERRTLSVERYGGNYSLAFFEARTGTKITDGPAVAADQAADCPQFAPYSQGEAAPRIYIEPETAKLETALKKFAG